MTQVSRLGIRTDQKYYSLNLLLLTARPRHLQVSQVVGVSYLHLRSFVTVKGPFSAKRPNMEVPPGPPCNQSNTGAFTGSDCRQKQEEL